MVEHKGHGVREDFPEQPACQMPEVTRPHPLYGVTLGELAENGVYAVAKTAQQGTPSGSRISLFGGVGGQKFNAHLRQLLSGLRRVVVTLSYNDPGGKLGEFWEHTERESSWALAGATQKRVISPGQQSLTCTRKP